MQAKVFEEKLVKEEEKGKWDFLKLKKSKKPPVVYHQLISSFVFMLMEQTDKIENYIKNKGANGKKQSDFSD